MIRIFMARGDAESGTDQVEVTIYLRGSASAADEVEQSLASKGFRTESRIG